MALWGKTNLSDAALRRIKELNNDSADDDLSGLQKKLLAAVRKTEPKCTARLGLLMDWPVSVRENVSECPPTVEKMDVDVMASNIAESVKSGSNINVVIDLVSRVTEPELDTIVTRSWSFLSEDEHKKSFIIAMSATKSSAVSVSKILLEMFTNAEYFDISLKLYGEVLSWLECNAVDALIVPLMMNENSTVAQNSSSCKAFFTSLTDAQRTDSIVHFSQSTNTLQEWQLQCLSVILELPVDPSVVPHLTHLLAAHVNEYSENRLMGKILLTLITLLSSSTPHHVFQEVSNLAGHFKGPLRFRLKQALANISKQIQSA